MSNEILNDKEIVDAFKKLGTAKAVEKSLHIPYTTVLIALKRNHVVLKRGRPHKSA